MAPLARTGPDVGNGEVWSVSEQHGTRLGGIHLFSSLSREELQTLDRQCRWRECPAQETILDRDSHDSDVYFVVQGTVEIVNYAPDGRRIALARVPAGGYFGELSAIDGDARSATVVATAKCRLAAISPDVFNRLLVDFPKISELVLLRLTSIIRACDDRIMDLSTLRAVHRVYTELVRLVRPDIVAPSNFVIRPMRTHADIASRISTTRETVARVLSQLAGDGVVERKGKTLYIRDMDRLSALAKIGDEAEAGLAR